MEETEYVELRSEEVQEILGTPPSWLVRWGSLVIFLCLAIMIAVSAIVRYPDVVSAPVSITTAIPPVDVVAEQDAYLDSLMVDDLGEVRENQVVALLKSTARADDVLRLESLLNRWAKMPEDSLGLVDVPSGLVLGELQAEYAELLRQFDKLSSGQASGQSDVRQSASATAAQIDRLKKGIANDERVVKRMEMQLTTARSLYQKQQNLYREGIISQVQLETERAKVTSLENQIDQMQDNIFRKENEVIALQRTLGNIRIEVQTKQQGNTAAVESAVQAMLGSIAQWKQRYLLVAPIAGKVSLNNAFFGAQQFVREGDIVLTIVPPSKKKLYGHIAVPIAGSGKIEAGQKVIIKLDNYPYHEYGTIEGKVSSKSLVPRNSTYRVQVILPEGLVTSYGLTLGFQQQLQGKAEIITSEKSFLQRITDQLFAGKKRRVLRND
jgi:hypothetical protein